jgi:excisionase family DNA binding protein
MTKHVHIGARTGCGGDADDDLTRLVRLIARQAAQEAFTLFKDALEASLAPARAPVDVPHRNEKAQEGSDASARSSADPAEQLLSVAEVARRLGISTKTVRRMIERRELPVHRIGKLLRISDRALSGRLAVASRQDRD